jgi:hypothetical protein
MKDCGRFLKNKEASAATSAMKLYKKSINAKNEEKKKGNRSDPHPKNL